MRTNEIIQPAWEREATKKRKQTFPIARLFFTSCKNDGNSENRQRAEVNVSKDGEGHFQAHKFITAIFGSSFISHFCTSLELEMIYAVI